ncbi:MULTISPECIES: hypothetical protein [unclassified Enterococcus]|uniref:hypothetical protein n=1 Tax=unclassified Enterococcus TaxID=2608891 RepID=UPI0015574C98|nr:MULTISPECIES: hypothetical protein [unclassified Enterococcus]MBS7577576.1 hypothetical protein [Enterococcus sp. MMGLQ5-2]MBS7584925.1 hypothetical protein [Enterococcus sp. MMGLQ5-1]NPD12780.1 hypothetical protein [Enterococcus sp. MMGLQ5-1]NPD37409.1 hypothetical protein [Enterococcus sp. MMGLQ5-2]
MHRIKHLRHTIEYFKKNSSFNQFLKQLQPIQICFELSLEEMKYLFLLLLKHEAFREYYQFFQFKQHSRQIENLTQTIAGQWPQLKEALYELHIDLFIYGHQTTCKNRLIKGIDQWLEASKQLLHLKLPFSEIQKHYCRLFEQEKINPKINIGFTEYVSKSEIDQFSRIYGEIFNFDFFYLPFDDKVDLLISKVENNFSQFQFDKQIFIEQLECPFERKKITQMLILIFQSKRL